MELTCHRCGGALPGTSIRGFCPQCGAPQITLSPEYESETAPTGAAPPPLAIGTGEVNWPIALGTGAWIAAVSGVLFAAGTFFPVLTGLGILLVVSAAFAVVGRYRTLSPGTPINAAIGARIGLSTGLLVCAVLLLALAAIGVIARFRLHGMGAFDAQWAQQSQLMLAKLREVGPVAPGTVAMVNAPEFRAGEMLAGMGLMGAMLLAGSAAMGAIAGSLTRGRKDAAQN